MNPLSQRVISQANGIASTVTRQTGPLMRQAGIYIVSAKGRKHGRRIDSQRVSRAQLESYTRDTDL